MIFTFVFQSFVLLFGLCSKLKILFEGEYKKFGVFVQLALPGSVS